MKDEGVIKFNCTWIKEEPLSIECISKLNTWREKMYEKGLIGCTEDGIGYGNISIRHDNHFIISGSGTGKIEHLTAEHYTVVTEYSFETNSVTARGPAIASSESLTHAMLYQCSKDINAVIHVHHYQLWKKILQIYPSTHRNVAYGTPEMAKEIQRLFKENSIAEHKLFAMGGHEEGIIAFGKNLEEAGKLVLDHLNTIRK
jgi:L-ribulose-5-phosphate 4-epimerase